MPDRAVVHGLLLAAGAGTRMGRPKALVPGWLDGSVAALREGGCERVTVVLGAAAAQARALVPPGASTVVAADWATGMAASLRTGLQALDAGTATAAVVHLVDLPDVTAGVVARLVAVAGRGGPDALARAGYAGVPGHPVLLGSAHWAGVAATARGDEGARAYLRSRSVTLVECGDLATGTDVDTPP